MFAVRYLLYCERESSEGTQMDEDNDMSLWSIVRIILAAVPGNEGEYIGAAALVV